MTFRDVVRARGCPPGSSRPANTLRHKLAVLYTRTVFPADRFLLCARVPDAVRHGWDDGWLRRIVTCACEGYPQPRVATAKWCYAASLSGTSRRESSSGGNRRIGTHRKLLAKMRAAAEIRRGGIVESLATPPRCARRAANEAKLKLYATCAMATAQLGRAAEE